MRRSCAGLVAMCSAATLLAACGGIPKHEDEEQVRNRYAAYAGDPIDRFVWLGRYDGWEALDKDELVVFTSPSEAYLLKVSGPCNDLPFANHIALTSTGGAVYSRLDAVKIGHWRCPIAEIRRIDYSRMRADLRLEAARAKAAAKSAS